MEAKIATGIGYEFVCIIPVDPEIDPPYAINFNGKDVLVIPYKNAIANIKFWKEVVRILNERLEADPSYVWDGDPGPFFMGS